MFEIWETEFAMASRLPGGISHYRDGWEGCSTCMCRGAGGSLEFGGGWERA